MVRVVVRAADRRASRTSRTALLLVASALVAALTATAAAPAAALGVPAATRHVAATALLTPDPVTDPAGDPPVDPGGNPADQPPPVDPPPGPEPTVPPPTETPTDPATTPPATPTDSPTPEVPATGEPTPPLPAPSSAAPLPGQSATAPRPDRSHLGVYVTTSDVTLAPSYWNSGDSRADLRVTVTNTGRTTESVRLAYTLPAGVTDAGTDGCSSQDGHRYRCGAWAAVAGARFSMRIRVRVDGDAWRRMPLNGSVQVTATAPGQSGQVSDSQGFAVLFPPGPPVPGMTLDADEVSFDITGASSVLDVELGNTGAVDATGAVEVVLPPGVTVDGSPAGCAPAGTDRTRCAVGTVTAGRHAHLRLPVSATPRAQRSAPLAGAVIGLLTPRAGAQKRMQMSFRIVAAAAAPALVASPAPTGSHGVLPGAVATAGDDGLSGAQQTAIALIVVSVLLVVLALVLATTSLRRRSLGDPPVEVRPGPTPATD
ncbi:hypothetical protein V6U90_20560 [Micromonospora sp. CPCC 206060]|uniref:hypothetical protein n=1 Tax=Micromonospora sp. CPCC 206060 TaxID=3122406 RepID=UPI002FF20022